MKYHSEKRVFTLKKNIESPQEILNVATKVKENLISTAT